MTRPRVVDDASPPEPELVPLEAVYEPESAGRGGDVLLHWVLLILCVAVLCASLLLSVRQREVALPVFGVRAPQFCHTKRLFGFDCPGCGLTRSFISLAHCDLRGAWNFNPAGPLFFALVMFQIPYRGLQIWRVRRGQPELSTGSWGARYLWLLALALIGQWCVRYALGLLA